MSNITPTDNSNYLNTKQVYLELSSTTLDNKQERLQQGGKNKRNKNELIDFLLESSNKNIKLKLNDILIRSSICDEVVGEGYVGKVRVSNIGNSYDIHYNDKTITVPIVIKESKTEGVFGFYETGKDLFIYSITNIVVEAIVLCFMKRFVELKLSPHLPNILDYGKCNENGKTPIDRFIIEKQGLVDEISMPIDGYYERPIWDGSLTTNSENKYLFKTKIAVLMDLFTYLIFNTYNEKSQKILPNNKKYDLIELLDYLTISYLITYDLMYKNNIHLMDMHSSNLFIHWLNENSYMGDKYIGDTEYIVYEHNNKYYKIKTFGLLLKIGDVGACIVKPRKNLYITGVGGENISKVDNLIKNMLNIQFCHYFLIDLGVFPKNIYKQTIAYKIMQEHPYNKLYWMNIPDNLLKDLKPVDVLLEEYFDKYTVHKNEIHNDKTLFIKQTKTSIF